MVNIQNKISYLYKKVKNTIGSTIRKILKIIIIVIVSGIVIVFLLLSVLGVIYETKEYNINVVEYNKIAEEYNALTAVASVSNIEGLPDNLGLLSEENESLSQAIKTLSEGNNPIKIKKDTQTLEIFIEEFSQDIDIIKNITCPSVNWICSKLNNIDLIGKYEFVTKDNDQDGMLERDGGYVSCVYFTVDLADPDSVIGDTVVDKGTDGGGAIEVYKSKAEAEERCEYLAQYDGTVLYSGSYAIVGTMVIRTSYRLSSDEQYELTNAIIEEFTDL